jgi:hypothetical protein
MLVSSSPATPMARMPKVLEQQQDWVTGPQPFQLHRHRIDFDQLVTVN